MPWDKATFERMRVALPETLVSRFQVTHAMLLSVLERDVGGGCLGIGRLIKASHDRDAEKRIHGRRARDLMRSLIDADIVTRATGEDGKSRLVVHGDLQEDFSLHHALSLYLATATQSLRSRVAELRPRRALARRGGPRTPTPSCFAKSTRRRPTRFAS